VLDKSTKIDGSGWLVKNWLMVVQTALNLIQSIPGVGTAIGSVGNTILKMLDAGISIAGPIQSAIKGEFSVNDIVKVLGPIYQMGMVLSPPSVIGMDDKGSNIYSKTGCFGIEEFIESANGVYKKSVSEVEQWFNKAGISKTDVDSFIGGLKNGLRDARTNSLNPLPPLGLKIENLNEAMVIWENFKNLSLGDTVRSFYDKNISENIQQWHMNMQAVGNDFLSVPMLK
jgi:hypothetical protein